MTRRLSDETGRTIGRVRQSGTDLVVEDASGRVKGRYDRKRDVTLDASGKVAYRGEALSLLLLDGICGLR